MFPVWARCKLTNLLHVQENDVVLGYRIKLCFKLDRRHHLGILKITIIRKHIMMCLLPNIYNGLWELSNYIITCIKKMMGCFSLKMLMSCSNLIINAN